VLHEQKYRLQNVQLIDKLAIVWLTFSYKCALGKSSIQSFSSLTAWADLLGD